MSTTEHDYSDIPLAEGVFPAALSALPDFARAVVVGCPITPLGVMLTGPVAEALYVGTPVFEELLTRHDRVDFASRDAVDTHPVEKADWLKKANAAVRIAKGDTNDQDRHAVSIEPRPESLAELSGNSGMSVPGCGMEVCSPQELYASALLSLADQKSRKSPDTWRRIIEMTKSFSEGTIDTALAFVREKGREVNGGQYFDLFDVQGRLRGVMEPQDFADNSVKVALGMSDADKAALWKLDKRCRAISQTNRLALDRTMLRRVWETASIRDVKDFPKDQFVRFSRIPETDKCVRPTEKTVSINDSQADADVSNYVLVPECPSFAHVRNLQYDRGGPSKPKQEALTR